MFDMVVQWILIGILFGCYEILAFPISESAQFWSDYWDNPSDIRLIYFSKSLLFQNSDKEQEGDDGIAAKRTLFNVLIGSLQCRC